MGGKAFTSRGLSTPRMPPKIYYHVLNEVQTKLRTVYAQAETPIEAPGKSDHGDVDVLVHPREGEHSPPASEIAELLDARDYFQTPKSTTTHFAVPWPEDDNSLPDDPNDTSESNLQPRYIQIDVNLSPTATQFHYTLFTHSHGDVGVALGATIRRFGLINTPTGLYIQIEALANWNRPLARVLVSTDPNTVLRYLGLDLHRYWTPFATWGEALDYVATSRFHDPRYGVEFDETDQREKFRVKNHDRSKVKQRAMLAYWFGEYLPQHRDGLVGSASHMSRDEVVEDAKLFFGEGFAQEYDERLRMGLRVLGREKLWSEVRKGLPCQGGDLTVAMKGLRLEIEGDEYEGEGEEVRKAYAEARFADVRAWVERNWVAVKKRQDERHRVQSTAKLVEHLEKRKDSVQNENEGGG